MFVTRCDLCKKDINSKPITVTIGFSPRFEFCEKCGLPILSFLEEKKLLKCKKEEKVGIKLAF